MFLHNYLCDPLVSYAPGTLTCLCSLDPVKCKQVRQIEEERERREALLKRIEEERQRRREMVTVSSRPSKQVASRSASAEEDPGGATGKTPQSKKFLNLFVNSSSHYSSTG